MELSQNSQAIIAIVGLILTFIGLAVGIVGIVIGWLADRKRANIEGYVQASVEAISKSLVRIKQRAEWAKTHFDKMTPDILDIPDKAKREDAIKRAKYGRADVTAIGDAHDIIQDQLSVLRTKGKDITSK